LLKNILESRGGSLINETLQGPSYLRKVAGIQSGPRGIPPLPLASSSGGVG